MTTTNEAMETIAISASHALVEVCVANKGPPKRDCPKRSFQMLLHSVPNGLWTTLKP
jgi:hypothetical protein